MLNLSRLFKKANKVTDFTCSCCGKKYDEMPLMFNADYPAHYYNVPENERSERIQITKSLCIIDDYYFHLCSFFIPIIDTDKNLIFNVWITISEANFKIRNTMWNDPDRIKNDPYFGYLQNIIPTYDSTLNLQMGALETEVGCIPSVEIIDETHPLFHDQQNGITYNDAVSKVQTILTEWHHE